jgi:hypothetical protein
MENTQLLDLIASFLNSDEPMTYVPNNIGVVESSVVVHAKKGDRYLILTNHFDVIYGETHLIDGVEHIAWQQSVDYLSETEMERWCVLAEQFIECIPMGRWGLFINSILVSGNTSSINFDLHRHIVSYHNEQGRVISIRVENDGRCSLVWTSMSLSLSRVKAAALLKALSWNMHIKRLALQSCEEQLTKMIEQIDIK